MEKVKRWFFDEEEDQIEGEYSIDVVDTEPKTSLFEQPKSTKTSETVSSLAMNKDSHLVLFEPRSYSEAHGIANHLKAKKATVVNLHRLQKDQSKRVIDFLTGVIYAIEGDIQRIGPKIFLCTPQNMNVGGKIDLDEEEKED